MNQHVLNYFGSHQSEYREESAFLSTVIELHLINKVQLLIDLTRSAASVYLTL